MNFTVRIQDMPVFYLFYQLIKIVCFFAVWCQGRLICRAKLSKGSALFYTKIGAIGPSHMEVSWHWLALMTDPSYIKCYVGRKYYILLVYESKECLFKHFSNNDSFLEGSSLRNDITAVGKEGNLGMFLHFIYQIKPIVSKARAISENTHLFFLGNERQFQISTPNRKERLIVIIPGFVCFSWVIFLPVLT